MIADLGYAAMHITLFATRGAKKIKNISIKNIVLTPPSAKLARFLLNPLSQVIDKPLGELTWRW
jgi:hypothetical protein